jgi:hypothetical protein
VNRSRTDRRLDEAGAEASRYSEVSGRNKH